MYRGIENMNSPLLHLKWKQDRKTYGFFVDFKSAFDSIDRSSLFYKLLNMGVSTNFVELLILLYSVTTAKVHFNGEFSSNLIMSLGAKQGCLLSPLSFALMINDLHDFLGGGLWIDEMNIRLLLYADDIIILVDDQYILQRMVKSIIRLFFLSHGKSAEIPDLDF